ncbi:MAG: DUF3168 domain-containing protein [Alphaproteobacteria bacterium]
MTASWAVQKAVLALLQGDATLMALVGGVHDHVAQEAAFPYVTLGEDRVAPFGSKTFAGTEHGLTLHVWSRARGRGETKAILARLRALLDQAPLAPLGHTLVDLRFTGAETLRDRDGLTYHGVARFRAVTQPS